MRERRKDKMKKQRISSVITVRIIVAAVLLGFIVAVAGCSMHTSEDSEQSEENGQADVKTADMYIEEAQAYIEAGNYLLAVQVLMEGAEELGDDSLAEKEKDLREHIIVRWKKNMNRADYARNMNTMTWEAW